MKKEVNTGVDQAFEEKMKRLALFLSDRLSAKLGQLLTFNFQDAKLTPYKNIQELPGDYFTFLLADTEQKKAVHALQAEIIWRLTNRFFGGQGTLDERPGETVFTYAESFVGKQFIQMVQDGLKLTLRSMKLLKTTESPGYCHVFLPEEDVALFQFSVKLNQETIGTYHIALDKKLGDSIL